jgi:hypothetical protein
LINIEDDKASEVEKCLSVFKLKRNYIFGDAEYYAHKESQSNLRKPEVLPKEIDILNIGTHILDKFLIITTDPFIMWFASEYVELSDLVVSRLTIFNAGEPARLELEEWGDAENGSWVNQTMLNSCEDELVKSTKIAYQSGKGNKLVSAMIPDDTVAAIKLLVDPEIRKKASIHVDNKYVFPSTKSSLDHTDGWHSLHNLCSRFHRIPGETDCHENKASNKYHYRALEASTVYKGEIVYPHGAFSRH